MAMELAENLPEDIEVLKPLTAAVPITVRHTVFLQIQQEQLGAGSDYMGLLQEGLRIMGFRALSQAALIIMVFMVSIPTLPDMPDISMAVDFSHRNCVLTGTLSWMILHGHIES